MNTRDVSNPKDFPPLLQVDFINATEAQLNYQKYFVAPSETPLIFRIFEIADQRHSVVLSGY
jgi:hypothetical protein